MGTDACEEAGNQGKVLNFHVRFIYEYYTATLKDSGVMWLSFHILLSYSRNRALLLLRVIEVVVDLALMLIKLLLCVSEVPLYREYAQLQWEGDMSVAAEILAGRVLVDNQSVAEWVDIA